MNDRVRLKQLHVLRDRVERLPASPQRDRVLEDVRRRAVDIESGMPTAPMRPLVPEEAVRLPDPPSATSASPTHVRDPSRARPKRRATPTQTHRASLRTGFVRSPTSVPEGLAVTSAETTATPLQEGIRLCLDDDVATSFDLDGRRPAAHWARGLRG